MSEGARALARFFGAVLIAVGGLITLLSGGCTVLFVGGALLGAARGSGPSALREFVLSALTLGAPVIALGLGLLFCGRALHRGPKP